jgi:dipeptidyl-peptidase-4
MKRTAFVTVLASAAAIVSVAAQDRLKLMPGYDQFMKMQPQIQSSAVVPGTVTAVTWPADGKGVNYTTGGKQMHLDFATGRAAAVPPPANQGSGVGMVSSSQVVPGRGNAGRGGGQSQGGMEQAQHEMPVAPMNGCPLAGVPRGRQAECAISPDGKFKAFYRARNFWVANADGTNEVQVTTDGSVEKRI